MNDIKQFKLTSGEEIICDVVEWPDFENNEADLVVRHAYKVFVHAETSDGTRIYTMRPWMLLQEDDDMFQTINGNHIVGEANPSRKMLEQYVNMVKHTEKEHELTSEELADKLSEHINNLRRALAGAVVSDSDDDNVIKFPNRTFH